MVNLLKTYFPFSFGAADVAELIKKIVIYVVAASVICLTCALIGVLTVDIKVLGVLLGLIVWPVTGIVGLYANGAIVIAILDFVGVIK